MRQISRLMVSAIGIVALLLPITASLASASFPGGNGKLLYWTSSQQLFDYDTSTGSRAISSGLQSAYSPDGTKIATWGSVGSVCNLRVMDADGANAVTITNATACDYQSPSFSPDGTKLVFVRSLPSGAAIGVIGVDGSNETTIASAPPGGYYTAPRWSPNGQTIAFSGSTTLRGNVDVYTVGVDGTGLVNLTAVPDGKHNYNAPDWAPDGSQLVFTHNAAGQEGWVAPGVWVIDADGTDLHPILLSSGCPSTNSAVWSPDGQRIAYSMRTGNCGPGVTELFTMDTDGTDRVQLTHGGDDKFVSDWQPSPAGGPVTVPHPPLADSLRNIQGFDVAADGVMAVVGVRTGEPDYGQTDLYLTPDGGGALSRVTFDGLSESIPSIADDHRVAYSPGGQSIVVRNADGSGRVQLAPTSNNCGYAAPAISPDASSVIWSNYCGGVHRIGSDGSGDIVLPVPSGTVVAMARYLARWQHDGRPVPQFRDLRTGNLHRSMLTDGSDFDYVLTTSEGTYWAEPSWSTDGTRLVMTKNDGSGPATELDRHEPGRLVADTRGRGHGSGLPPAVAAGWPDRLHRVDVERRKHQRAPLRRGSTATPATAVRDRCRNRPRAQRSAVHLHRHEHLQRELGRLVRQQHGWRRARDGPVRHRPRRRPRRRSRRDPGMVLPAPRDAPVQRRPRLDAVRPDARRRPRGRLLRHPDARQPMGRMRAQGRDRWVQDDRSGTRPGTRNSQPEDRSTQRTCPIATGSRRWSRATRTTRRSSPGSS